MHIVEHGVYDEMQYTNGAADSDGSRDPIRYQNSSGAACHTPGYGLDETTTGGITQGPSLA